MRTLRNLSGLVAAGIGVWALAASAFAADYSIDIRSFSYGYGTTEHTLDFSLGADFTHPHVDPATGMDLSWQDFIEPGVSGWVGSDGVYRLSVPQAVAPPPPPGATSGIVGAGTLVGGAPLNWHVSAELTNIQNATTPGNFYLAGVGGDNLDRAAPGVKLYAEWFNGNDHGVAVDHALELVAQVRVGGYSWRGGDVVLTDLNPADTTIELRVDVSDDGRTYTGSYRLDHAPLWTVAYTHTLPASVVGTLPGFYGTFPLVSMSTEVGAVPEPGSVALMLGGLVLLAGYGRRRAH